jgi:hypothetical protein
MTYNISMSILKHLLSGPVRWLVAVSIIVAGIMVASTATVNASPINPLPPPIGTPTVPSPTPVPVFPAAGSTYDGSDRLALGQNLLTDHYLRSANGQYLLLMQGDGNLVLYRSNGQAVWATGTNGSGPGSVNFQADGNVVLYRSNGQAAWATATDGYATPGFSGRFQLQDDGILVLWWGGKAIWKSNGGLLVPSAVSATRVTSKLKFHDAYQNADLPIRGAKVEVWRYRPQWWFVWGWSHDDTVWSNGQGEVNVSMPYLANGVTYALRVVAENRAAHVKPNPRNAWDGIASFFGRDGSMWTEPGYDHPKQAHSTAAGQAFDISDTFTGWPAQHFNIADAALYAHDYAAAHRGDSDDLGPVWFTWRSGALDWFIDRAYYDPYMGPSVRLSMIGPDYLPFDDELIVHEYSHGIQHQIGALYAMPAYHGPCQPEYVANSQLAWSEGFADYVTAMVVRANPGKLYAGSGSPIPQNKWEPSPQCGNLTEAGDRIEKRVTAALWDLADPANTEDPAPERENLIFQIFDNELDRSRLATTYPLADRIAQICPTVSNLRAAWQSRGLDVAEFDQVMAINHVTISSSFDYFFDGCVGQGGHAPRGAAPGLDSSYEAPASPTPAATGTTSSAILLPADPQTLQVDFHPQAAEMHIGDWTGYAPVQNLPMDVDNNGLRDLVRIFKNASGKAMVDILFSNGAAFYRPGPASPVDVGGWDESGAPVQNLALDVNGDGREDLLRLWRNGAGTMNTDVLYSDGTGLGRPATPIVQELGAWDEGGVPVQILTMYVNNDTKADLVRIQRTSAGKTLVEALLSDGATFHRPVGIGLVDVGGWDESGAPVQNLAMDVNGDRQEDLVRLYRTGDGKAFTDVLFSSGAGFGRPANPVTLDTGDWVVRGEAVQNLAMDVDADGKTDLLRVFKTGTGRRAADVLYARDGSFYRPNPAVVADVSADTGDLALVNASRPLTDKTTMFQLRNVSNQTYVQTLQAW